MYFPLMSEFLSTIPLESYNTKYVDPDTYQLVALPLFVNAPTPDLKKKFEVNGKVICIKFVFEVIGKVISKFICTVLPIFV